MAQAPHSPLGDQTARGHGPPFCTQFSVFLENRVGKLYELLNAFDGQPIKIAAISVVDASDHAVVRLVTSHSDRARHLLQARHIPFTESEILVVELGTNPSIAKLCLALLAAELNIDYAYPLMLSRRGGATLAIQTDNSYLAGQILRRKGFPAIGEEELRQAAGPDPAVG